MTYTTAGLPNYTPPAYYLGPATGTQTIVATTPIGGLKLAVVPFLAGSVKAATVTINTCPVKAAATTATNMGVIGYTIAGVAMFNSYEATLVPALSDNVCRGSASAAHGAPTKNEAAVHRRRVGWGRIDRAQFGMRRFQVDQLAIKPVIVLIRNQRLRLLIIGAIKSPDFVR